jgi:hypothetical protein
MNQPKSEYVSPYKERSISAIRCRKRSEWTQIEEFVPVNDASAVHAVMMNRGLTSSSKTATKEEERTVTDTEEEKGEKDGDDDEIGKLRNSQQPQQLLTMRIGLPEDRLRRDTYERSLLLETGRCSPEAFITDAISIEKRNHCPRAPRVIQAWDRVPRDQ